MGAVWTEKPDFEANMAAIDQLFKNLVQGVKPRHEVKDRGPRHVNQ